MEKVIPDLHLLLYKVAPKFVVSKIAVIFWVPKTASLEDLVIGTSRTNLNFKYSKRTVPRDADRTLLYIKYLRLWQANQLPHKYDYTG